MKDEDGRQEQVIRSDHLTGRHGKLQLSISINGNSFNLKELKFGLVNFLHFKLHAFSVKDKREFLTLLLSLLTSNSSLDRLWIVNILCSAAK